MFYIKVQQYVHICLNLCNKEWRKKNPVYCRRGNKNEYRRLEIPNNRTITVYRKIIIVHIETIRMYYVLWKIYLQPLENIIAEPGHFEVFWRKRKKGKTNAYIQAIQAKICSSKLDIFMQIYWTCFVSLFTPWIKY